MYKKILHFLLIDIWRIPLKKYSPRKHFFIYNLRILLLSIRGFAEDKVQMRASALTFYTMLSVVPVAAMALAIAQGFGFEDMLKTELTKTMSGQETIVNWILEFANKFLSTLSGGVVAGIGIALLFWTVMKVLGNIETSFNAIWQVKKSRNFTRKFSDYLSMILIAPILIIISSSLKVYIITRVTKLTEQFDLLEFFGPFLLFMFKLLPLVLIIVVFTVVYMVMPNTRVQFKYAAIAGVFAGTLFHALEWVYIKTQFGLSGYNAIYGSFAAVPLFLIWLQYSWLIVLLGAEISFSYQNVENYEFETDIENISAYNKKLLTFIIVHMVVKRFEKGQEAYTAHAISHESEIPIRLVKQLINELIECKILSEVIGPGPQEIAYQPATDINKITTDFVLKKIELRGSDHISVKNSVELDSMKNIQNSFMAAIEKSSGNKLIKDI